MNEYEKHEEVVIVKTFPSFLVFKTNNNETIKRFITIFILKIIALFMEFNSMKLSSFSRLYKGEEATYHRMKPSHIQWEYKCQEVR